MPLQFLRSSAAEVLPAPEPIRDDAAREEVKVGENAAGDDAAAGGCDVNVSTAKGDVSV